MITTERVFCTANHLFAIPSHYSAEDFGNIKREAAEVAELFGCPVDDINVYQIKNSPRYLGMTCYFIPRTAETVIPEFAYNLKDSWDMYSWLLAD